MKEYKSEEWLREKYCDEEASMTDIAAEVGTSAASISYWLRKYGITEWYNSNEPYNDKEWLADKYHRKGMKLKEISELDECNVSPEAIYHRLDYYNLSGETKTASYVTLAKSQGVPEDSLHLDDKWLYKKYIEEELTIAEIAEIDGVKASKSSVKSALDSFGIETRTEGFRNGEKHHRYKPDYENDYGEYWQEIAKHIRERDSFKCKSCGVSQNHHIQSHDRKLDVHHIEPLSDFESIERANRDENLVTLCRSCHRKVEHGSINCP